MAFRPLNAEEHFSANPLSVDIKRSTFDRSFGHVLTMPVGKLVPIMVDEILPGDTIDIDSSVLARLLAPTTPVMDDLYIDFSAFFVPNRLLWTHWKEFCGENNTSYWTQPTVYQVPFMTVPASSRSAGDLLDHMGCPMPISQAGSAPTESTVVSALFPRAYLKVWNDWWRNETIQAPQIENTSDTQTAVVNTLLPVNRAHDYFGSAFPSPQKGTAASVALTGTIPVSSGVANANSSSSTASMSVNDIRVAFATQRVMEKLSYGSRYIEMVANIFGVRSPDARVQRSEFLGSGRMHINMQDVIQSSESGTTPQGTVTGFSKTADKPLHIFKSFTEHGIFLILACARHRRTYAQGLNRMFSRKNFLDFYMPPLAYLPPQPILEKEIYYYGGTLPGNDTVFAYQERWAEMRYKPSYASGLMNPVVAGTLGLAWTYVDKYDSSNIPAFNSTWIQEGENEVMRTMSVQNQDPILLDTYFNFKHTRVMPVFSVPGLVDHF